MDYWASLEPVSYGYLDLVYSDRDFQIGLLQNIKIIDENHLEATFAPSENTKYMDAKTIPDDDYVLSKTLATGDTFIPRCNEKNLFVYKLQDIEIREDVSFAVFTYRIGQSDAVPCEFPQILEHSFGVSFEWKNTHKIESIEDDLIHIFVPDFVHFTVPIQHLLAHEC